MTQIYLIRHGETASNKENRMQGWLDTDLSETGLQQSAALGQRFRELPVDAVYSSDLRRAMRTAQAICDAKNLPLQTDPALRELNLGDWSGRTNEEIAEKYSENLALYRTSPDLWKAPDGESYAQLRQRMDDAMKKIAAKHPGQRVAVVSHGGSIKMLLSLYKGLSILESKCEPIQPNTAVTLLEFDDQGVRIVYQGDATHLAQPATTHKDAAL